MSLDLFDSGEALAQLYFRAPLTIGGASWKPITTHRDKLLLHFDNNGKLRWSYQLANVSGFNLRAVGDEIFLAGNWSGTLQYGSSQRAAHALGRALLREFSARVR